MKKANWWIGLLWVLGAAVSWGADNLYMVVDMSGGLEAASWPVSYLSGVPSGGWDYDHKTSKLVLRRIEKGTFTMGSPRGEFGRADDETQHKVTLTKDYYIGVFEFTQQQWMFAMSENPSEYSATAAPVENVNYARIRGGELGAEWPASNDVDAESFLAVMRTKTGLAFDLPTEAQWEYACRAGTTTALNSGKNLTSEVACPNMDEVGRYYYNQYDGKGGYSAHTTVGNYAVNNWGLYDMHGNIEEWCLDWVDDYASGSVTNPVGPASSPYDWRAYRGGCWNDEAEDCRSARRGGMDPNQYMAFGEKPGLYIGFRLACAAPSTQKQTVTFDTHGGICPTATKTYAIATTYGSLPTASRKGYSFNGWFTDEDGGHEVTIYSIVTDESTRTLHAQWTPGEQVVTFNANGGECWTDSRGYTIGTQYGEFPSAKRDGYAFNGWFTAPSGGTLVTTESTVTTDSTRTLFAQWTPGQQVVTFNPAGGTCDVETATYTVGSAFGTLPTPLREGYVFDGWFFDEEDGGEGCWYDGEVTTSTIVSADSTNSWMTLRVSWAPGMQTVTFNPNGGKCETKEGQYRVTGNYVTLPIATLDGGVFVGWFTEADGGEQVTEETTVAASWTRTLYAHWFFLFRVCFDANGGNGNMYDQQFAYGTPQALFSNAYTRVGYEFGGWATTADGKVQYADGSVVSNLTTYPNGIVNLFARWIPHEYRVCFDGKGGTGAMECQSFVFGQPQMLVLNAYSKTGYTFAGWSTGEEAENVDYEDGAVVSNLTAEADGNVTFWAVWSRNSCTVHFQPQGGSGNMAATTLYYDESEDTISLPLNTFVRSGCRFAGWATRPGGAPVLRDGANVQTWLEEGSVKDITLYAVWLPEEGPYLDFCMGTTARERLFWFYGKAEVDYLLQRTQELSGQEWETVKHVMCRAAGAIVLTNNAPEDWKTSFWRLIENAGDYGFPYLVVDLSGGPDAQRWPVEFFDEVPEGGFNTDEYKTTKLVLRRIEAGTFTMGSPEGELGRTSLDGPQHEVTLTQPFYIGVFEVTQKQWELVMGSNPAEYFGETRPVERVSYDMIRGSSAGAKWPESSEVDAESFMGKLREKTAIGDSMVWDLPTEAQWEYACRAGTTTALNSGKNLTSEVACPNMDEVGRYYCNQYDGKGGYSSYHTKVGNYLPNAWGLYDMHGNVVEWCLDWWNKYLDTSAVEDPVGAASGSYRVVRGGDWSEDAMFCRSAFRCWEGPALYTSYILGFRLARILPIGYSQENKEKGDVR